MALTEKRVVQNPKAYLFVLKYVLGCGIHHYWTNPRLPIYQVLYPVTSYSTKFYFDRIILNLSLRRYHSGKFIDQWPLKSLIYRVATCDVRRDRLRSKRLLDLQFRLGILGGLLCWENIGLTNGYSHI